MKLLTWFRENILGITKCPACGKDIYWNEGWEKWNNCPFCKLNPNYFSGMNVGKKKIKETK